ncbi:MAG: PKD domain-containing protein [Pirellulaceae bacterium]
MISRPIANAGGPYVSDEGQSILLDASGTTDPNHANSLLQFAWDLNYDGTFGPEIVHGERPLAVSQQDFAARVIALRVTDPAGLSNIATTTWEVREVAPFVSFAWLLPEDSDGLKVQFFGAANTLNSSDTIAAWRWNFGAAGESADPNPVITFPADGSYQVTLTVIDSDGSSASITQTVAAERTTSGRRWRPIHHYGRERPALDARKSSDPSDETLSFAWDLDNDGQFDDAAGEYPVVTWQSLAENTPQIADSGVYTIGVQVSDGRGGVDGTASARRKSSTLCLPFWNWLCRRTFKWAKQ